MSETKPAPLIRGCVACTDRDTGPRHTFGVLGTVDRATVPAPWHIECHARAGCPTCIQTLAEQGDANPKETDRG